MSSVPTLTIRPAYTGDIPAIARLMVQLFHAEMPGTLRGSLDAQEALLRFTLERSSNAMFRRYIVVNTADHVLGTASLRLARDRLIASMPPGTMREARKLLGMIEACRLFSALVRSSLAPETALNGQEAFIHSVVVEEQARGHGVGAWLISEIERTARLEGARAAKLRVVVGNEGAKRLYQRLGYRVIGRTPSQLDWLLLPTELMSKTFASTA